MDKQLINSQDNRAINSETFTNDVNVATATQFVNQVATPDVAKLIAISNTNFSDSTNVSLWFNNDSK